jgi:hypothetical protein
MRTRDASGRYRQEVQLDVYANINIMKRTTIYLEPELEVLLKVEMQRQKRPMAQLVRDAVRAYLTRAPRTSPPGAGAFSSGHTDTAERVETLLARTGFGAPPGARTRRRRT